MSASPDVSVIVTNYNSEQYLPQALASLKKQTFRNFEVIVVDDGSKTKVARDIVQKFAGTDQLDVRYFYKQNGGPSSARNFGLQYAQGNYIAFLDADDYYAPEKLTLQLSLLEEKSDDYCCVNGAACKFDDMNPQRTWIVKPSHVNGFLNIQLFLLGEVKVEGTPGYLFKRDALHSVGGYDETLTNNEDFDLLLRLAVKFKIQTHTEIAFFRRMRSDSLSKGDPIKGLRNSIKFITKTQLRLTNIEPWVFERRKQKAFFNAAYLCLKQGRLGEFKDLMKRGKALAEGITTWRGVVAYIFSLVLPIRSQVVELGSE